MKLASPVAENQQYSDKNNKPVANTQHSESAVLADALCHYVEHFGKKVALEDLAIGLPVKSAELTDDLVPRALARFGLSGEVQTLENLQQTRFPVCAFLSGNRYAIIVACEAGFYHVHEPQISSGVRLVDIETLDKEYTGKAIVAGHAFSALEHKHIRKTESGHWFWSLFREKRGLITNVVIGSLVANMLAVGISLFTLQVYDRVIPNQSEATLWVLLAGAAIAIIFEAVLRVARATLIDVTGRDIEIKASSWLFQRLQGMKLSKVSDSPGTLLYSIREFSSIREFFTTTSISAVADIPFVLMFVALIYFIAGPVVLIVIAAMVLIIVPSLLSQKKIIKLNEEMLGGSACANKILIEATYGQEAIKSARAENHFQKQWEEVLLLNAVKMTEQRLLAAKLQYWSSAVQHTAFVSAITAGCYLVFMGELSIGAIIAISILTSRTLNPITALSPTLARWHMVKSSLQMMEKIADAEQDVHPDKSYHQADSLKGQYQLENTTFAFSEDARPALQINGLTFESGSSTAILGSNGSGKSTLLRLLAGLLEPTEGSITLDGLLINKIAPTDLRRHVGFLPQEVRLFSGTLRENLEMVCGQRSDKDLFEALEFAGLAAFTKTHIAGLDMPIADGGTGVSVGQKQSIGLARLYLQDPSIVLMDEPTASFDQTLEQQLITNLKTWLLNKTCIFTTHRPAVLALSENLVVLQNGRVNMTGPSKEILAELSEKRASSFKPVAA